MTAVYVFGGILAILLIAVVVAPLLERPATEPPLEDLGPSARRDAALRALRELEFEYQTGKLTREDYLAARRTYGRAALEARDRIEEAGSGAGPACPACGEPVTEGAKYCTGCGGPLSGAREAAPDAG
ncbi:MAG: hypothetical protein ACE5HF_10110 [Gemmatimonadota bacterium]